MNTETRPIVMVRLDDFSETPDVDFMDYIIKNDLIDKEFDYIEIIETLNRHHIYKDISWFMIKCKKARTKEVFNYFMSFNPDRIHLSLKFKLNPFFQDFKHLLDKEYKKQKEELIAEYNNMTKEELINILIEKYEKI
jgi:hypothetical protein